MAKNIKQSTPTETSKAAKALNNPHSSQITKSLAGSVLSQAPKTSKGK